MSYVGAPYNFVPFGTKVNRRDSVTKHNEITGMSGYLEYQVTAQTSIVVDGGDGHFYKNKDGKAAIPGSTMRGLVRNNMLVLSQSSVADDIKDSKLMYRCVGGSKNDLNKKIYEDTLGATSVEIEGKSVSVLKNVKGGYIRCKNGHYYIVPACVQKLQDELDEMNYYVLSERWIGGKEEFEVLKKSPFVLQHDLSKPFKRSIVNGWIHYRGEKNVEYKPYYETIYYLPKGTRNIAALSDKPQKEYKKGTLISTGFMNEKKVFYVIPEPADIPESEWTKIDDVDSFKRDFEGRKNQLMVAAAKKLTSSDKEEKKEKLKNDIWEFFGLPKDGETKPVFYIKIGEKLYFGFTPRLRLFYDKKIYDGLPAEQKDKSLDYCKAMFGYASEKTQESYRSRLSFRDAEVDKTAAEGRKESTVLGEPKPTSYLDYLVGVNGSPSTYNGDFRLRGMKQYWLHEKTAAGDVGNNKEVRSGFYPYPAGTSFTGQVRFTNLTSEELGMLLWSLLLEKNSQQNVGKGKPYGYGRIRVSLKKLEIMDPDRLYGGDSLCLDPYQDQKDRCGEYIDLAKKEMTKSLGRDVMSYPPIRDFLWMKDAREMPDESKIAYMKINNREYRDRKENREMLDTIGGVLGKERRKKWRR